MRLCLHLAFAVRGGPVGAGVAQQIASAGAAQKMLGGVSGSDIVHTLSVSAHFQVSKHFTFFHRGFIMDVTRQCQRAALQCQK